MKKKNYIKVNSFRSIRKQLPRFFSLMIMSMLGVFAFSGLQATAPDMLVTLDNHLDKFNTYDIKLVSTMGLIEEDIEALNNIKDIELVEGSYSKDTIIKIDEDESVVNISSIPKDINKLDLLEGRFPEKDNEIVVEKNLLSKKGLKLGDKITVEDKVFKEKELKIVGTINSTLYFNNATIEQKRGNTSVGAGDINYYAYMNSTNFDQDYYSAIYLTVENAKSEITGYTEYKNLIANVTKKLEGIKTEREEFRYNKIYSEANDKIKNKQLEADENLNKYNKGIEEYNKNKEETQKEINKAENDLQNIKQPKWYIYDRTDYSTYSDYIDDTNSITNLSKVFPTVFFAVAILVSLISMNRMVEEDRLEIGTLKSLGFCNRQILSKYLIFSFLATILGCILGSVFGLIIIPLMIFNIYKILFDIPNFCFGLNLWTTVIGFIIVIICVCGTSIITVYKVLKEKPSDLMRPKSPKKGKRVFLENIKFIWNNINFSKKVTIRNLFRYKKRVIVTVGGIAGCTALMLCGFGIKNAISDIPSKQYDDIYKFDAMVFANDFKSEDIDKIFNDTRITNYTEAQNLNATVNNINVNMFICDNINEIVNLKDFEKEEKIRLEKGKVIITEKLADLAKLKKGDKIKLVDVNNKTYEYEISDITKNYLEHYIYIDTETFGEFQPNMVYINTKNLSNNEKSELSKSLLEKDGIVNVIYKSTLITNAENMLKSLNKVVLILIILAAMLSFVVLYNLSNINITERKREIATLKVLGFFDKEVDDYITKENIILTIIGIVIGLVLGYFLTNIVVATVEIERARFIYKIKFLSYIYTIRNEYIVYLDSKFYNTF